jgi:hypothetical protein
MCRLFRMTAGWRPLRATFWVLEARDGDVGEGIVAADAASPAGTVRVRSGALGTRAAVIVASEQMDEDPRWRMLAPRSPNRSSASSHTSEPTAPYGSGGS